MRTRLGTLLIILALGVWRQPFAAAKAVGTPTGWHEAGSDPGDYEMIIDHTVTYAGKGAGCIRSIDKDKARGFGTMMQSFRADAYRGKRIRMSAYGKFTNIQHWAGLWMRVDVDDKAVSFDNMQNRPFKDTQNWKRYDIVLDVPPNATKIAFGVLLHGPGTVWVDNFHIEEVDTTVPTTDIENSAKNPRNLSFEEP